MKRTPQQVDEMILRANEIAPEWWPSVVARGVADHDGCYIWTATPNRQGYGTCRLPRAVGGHSGWAPHVRVHRAALVLHLGRPLGEGMVASHKCHDAALLQGLCAPGECRHRLCFAVGHIAEESNAANLRAGGGFPGEQSRRKFCKDGHPLSGPDALLSQAHLRQGHRMCLICLRAWGRQQKEAVA